MTDGMASRRVLIPFVLPFIDSSVMLKIGMMPVWDKKSVLLSKLTFDSCSVGRLYESMGDEVDICI